MLYVAAQGSGSVNKQEQHKHFEYTQTVQDLMPAHRHTWLT